MKIFKYSVLASVIFSAASSFSAADELTQPQLVALKNKTITAGEVVATALAPTDGAATADSTTFARLKAILIKPVGVQVDTDTMDVTEGAKLVGTAGNASVTLSGANLTALGATTNMKEFIAALDTIYTA